MRTALQEAQLSELFNLARSIGLDAKESRSIASMCGKLLKQHTIQEVEGFLVRARNTRNPSQYLAGIARKQNGEDSRLS